MPPGSWPRGLRWRLTIAMRSTVTLDASPSTFTTLPVFPLSRPAITITVSPFLMFGFAIVRLPVGRRPSEDLRCERDDLHELLRAQLACDRPEDAGADRLA